MKKKLNAKEIFNCFVLNNDIIINVIFLLQDYNIMYELNVSTNCPKPDFIADSHFMRIPINDNYSEKLLPFFPKAYEFLGMKLLLFQI